MSEGAWVMGSQGKAFGSSNGGWGVGDRSRLLVDVVGRVSSSVYGGGGDFVAGGAVEGAVGAALLRASQISFILH